MRSTLTVSWQDENRSNPAIHVTGSGDGASKTKTRGTRVCCQGPEETYINTLVNQARVEIGKWSRTTSTEPGLEKKDWDKDTNNEKREIWTALYKTWHLFMEKIHHKWDIFHIAIVSQRHSGATAPPFLSYHCVLPKTTCPPLLLSNVIRKKKLSHTGLEWLEGSKLLSFPFWVTWKRKEKVL